MPSGMSTRAAEGVSKPAARPSSRQSHSTTGRVSNPAVPAGLRMWVNGWSIAGISSPSRVKHMGALICTPVAPACDRCHVRDNCEARRLGLQDAIPPKKKAVAVTAVAEVGVVIRDGGKLLLCRRPADAGRWQNMWEVPHAERRPDEPADAAAVRVAAELTGLTVTPGAELLTVKHGVTRWAITMTVLEAARTGGEFAAGFYPEARWVLPAELAGYPVSSPQRKLMTELTKAGRQGRLF